MLKYPHCAHPEEPECLRHGYGIILFFLRFDCESLQRNKLMMTMMMNRKGDDEDDDDDDDGSNDDDARGCESHRSVARRHFSPMMLIC